MSSCSNLYSHIWCELSRDILSCAHGTRLNSIHVLFPLTINHQWPMFQLDMKNVFLNGDLEEEVYMSNLWICYSGKEYGVQAQEGDI